MKIVILFLVATLVSCRFLPIDRPTRVFGSHYISNSNKTGSQITLLKSETNKSHSFCFLLSVNKRKRLKYDSYMKMGDSLNVSSDVEAVPLVIPAESVLYLGQSSSLRKMFKGIIIGNDTVNVAGLIFDDKSYDSEGITLKGKFRYEFN